MNVEIGINGRGEDLLTDYVRCRRDYAARLRATAAQMASEVGAEARDCAPLLEGYLRQPSYEVVNTGALLERMRRIKGFDDRIEPLQALAARQETLAEEHAQSRGHTIQEGRTDLHERYMLIAGVADTIPDITQAERVRIDTIVHRYVWIYRLGRRIAADACRRIAVSRGLSSLDRLTCDRVADLFGDEPDPLLRAELTHAAGASCVSSRGHLLDAQEDCILDVADILGVIRAAAQNAVSDHIASIDAGESSEDSSFVDWARARYA